uniref:Uncharacterized protein n=1 Tax=Setaria viridis TaxID=4556 RepID=A0A4U6T945_SETVI|nr:hypothetical protein SEVIR_9G560100v2 [Setaria viridis]
MHALGILVLINIPETSKLQVAPAELCPILEEALQITEYTDKKRQLPARDIVKP